MQLATLTSLLVFIPVLILARPLRISVYDFPPHVEQIPSKKKPQGPAIAFIEDSLRTNRIEWNFSPFSRAMLDLENGTSDVGLLVAKTPVREAKLRFSQSPLFTTSSAIIVPIHSPLAKAKSLKSFRGMTLGHSQDSVRPSFLKDNSIKIDALSGERVIERNLHRLRNGRLDGIFVPTASNGKSVLRALKAEKEFALFVIPEATLKLYVVFRKDIDEQIFSQINDYLLTHRDKYTKLLNQAP